MQCGEINDLTMKYFDGDVSQTEIELIYKHNQTCSRCAEEFDMLKSALYTFEDLPELEAPEGFEERVMAQIRMQTAYSAKPQFSGIWLVAIVGIMIFELSLFNNIFMPYIQQSGILVTVYNGLMYASTWTVNFFKEAFIFLSLGISKMLIFRTILLRDYLTLITIMTIFLITTNMYLIKTLKIQQH